MQRLALSPGTLKLHFFSTAYLTFEPIQSVQRSNVRLESGAGEGLGMRV